MNKCFLSTVLAVALLWTSGMQSANAQTDNQPLTVAVGIVPAAAFVQAVAGDLAHVVTLIPPGNSPANYQPTALEMRELSDAAVYFTLQMPTEQANILPKIPDFNSDIVIVDLQAATAAVYPMRDAEEDADAEDHDGHEHGAADPHIWLSPKRAAVMVQTIAETLAMLDAGNADQYQASAAAYIAKLEALDGRIREMTEALADKSFIIYHGAYGYFADDYGLQMIAIEVAGKQATAAELQHVIDLARKSGIRIVFYQDEFDDNQAATVAEEIGGYAQNVAPLSFDYIQGLEDFASALARGKN